MRALDQDRCLVLMFSEPYCGMGGGREKPRISWECELEYMTGWNWELGGSRRSTWCLGAQRGESFKDGWSQAGCSGQSMKNGKRGGFLVCSDFGRSFRAVQCGWQCAERRLSRKRQSMTGPTLRSWSVEGGSPWEFSKGRSGDAQMRHMQPAFREIGSRPLLIKMTRPPEQMPQGLGRGWLQVSRKTLQG